MEFIKKENVINLKNTGVTSKQIICPANSDSDKVTVTEVHLEPQAVQSRHSHELSEQIWYAIKGSGKLLLADNAEKLFKAGDAVRFEKNDTHGLYNCSDEEFVYISVTSPPVDFSYAYRDKGKQ